VVRAGGTVSLVLADRRILVDTGGPAERDVVVALLAGRGLTPDQIDTVVCSHGHIDHVGNNNLFPHATFILGQDRSVGDAFSALEFKEIASGARIVPTPGHTSEDLSVLVETAAGVVAIAGDVFESAYDDESWVQYSRDPERQRRSRAELLEVADFIVPGHGEMFRCR